MKPSASCDVWSRGLTDRRSRLETEAREAHKVVVGVAVVPAGIKYKLVDSWITAVPLSQVMPPRQELPWLSVLHCFPNVRCYQMYKTFKY
jgi:hypothetical protein